MMRISKPLVAVASAVLFLCGLVAVAGANRLSSSATTMRAAIPRAGLTGGFGTATCNLTLEGSMHSAQTTKTAGALLGYITRASVGPCAVGSATVLTATLPWHVQYGSYTGSLPDITSIKTNIIGASWSIREPAFGITCLFRTTTSEPNTATFEREAGGLLEAAVIGGTIESNCGIRGAASGETVRLSVTREGRIIPPTLTTVGTTTAITVTLI